MSERTKRLINKQYKHEKKEGLGNKANTLVVHTHGGVNHKQAHMITRTFLPKRMRVQVASLIPSPNKTKK